jgi:hypothetical protein
VLKGKKKKVKLNRIQGWPNTTQGKKTKKKKKRKEKKERVKPNHQVRSWPNLTLKRKGRVKPNQTRD